MYRVRFVAFAENALESRVLCMCSLPRIGHWKRLQARFPYINECFTVVLHVVFVLGVQTFLVPPSRGSVTKPSNSGGKMAAKCGETALRMQKRFIHTYLNYVKTACSVCCPKKRLSAKMTQLLARAKTRTGIFRASRVF